VSHACTSKLAPGVSSGRLGLVCSRLGMSEAESGRLGADSGRLGVQLFCCNFPRVVLGSNQLSTIDIYIPNRSPGGIEYDLVKEILKDAKASGVRAVQNKPTSKLAPLRQTARKRNKKLEGSHL
ncbi:hypothetical protein PIB30_096498, partial [Stylosanthes scabra]|nr:hypothetical protein [Stylosanthes scabra]